jgi:hypothetical protein
MLGISEISQIWILRLWWVQVQAVMDLPACTVADRWPNKDQLTAHITSPSASDTQNLAGAGCLFQSFYPFQMKYS